MSWFITWPNYSQQMLRSPYTLVNLYWYSENATQQRISFLHVKPYQWSWGPPNAHLCNWRQFFGLDLGFVNWQVVPPNGNSNTRNMFSNLSPWDFVYALFRHTHIRSKSPLGPDINPIITLHYITLHYVTLHCIALHYITYITLHQIKVMDIAKSK